MSITSRHRIAALLRFLLNLKGRVLAARGARPRYAAKERRDTRASANSTAADDRSQSH
jgi:hypothetical protein